MGEWRSLDDPNTPTGKRVLVQTKFDRKVAIGWQSRFDGWFDDERQHLFVEFWQNLPATNPKDRP